MLLLGRRRWRWRWRTFLPPSPTSSPSISIPISRSSSSQSWPQQPLFVIDPSALVHRLQTSLQDKDADQIWRSLQKLHRAGVDLSEDNPRLIADSLSLFAASADELCLLRAHKVISRLHKEEKLELVDGKVLASLSMAYAKVAMFDLSANAFRLMLQRHRYPPLSFWKPLLELWAQNTRGAIYTVRVFLEICRYCCAVGPKALFLVSGDAASANKPKQAEKFSDEIGCASSREEENINDKMAASPLGTSYPDASSAASNAFGTSSLVKPEKNVNKILDDRVGRVALVKPDTEAFVVALRACALLCDVEKAEEIIDQMGRFSLAPSNACFRALMKAYEKTSQIDHLHKVLVRMKRARKVPDRATLNSLVTSCINIGETDIAADLVLSWTGKFENDIDTAKDDGHDDRGSTAAKQGICNEIHESICEWRTVLEPPCAETYTLLLKGFLEKNKVANAANYVAKIFQTPNSKYVACGLALEGALQRGLRDEIKCMLEAMAIKNMPADNMSYGMLVKAYCKLPQPVKAEAVLQDACKVGHLLDIGFYVSVIDAYNLVQDYNSAHRVFYEMKCRGVSPLEPILDRLLAFFEKQDKPYLMLKLLNTSARDPPLKMALHHWNRTIQVFCRGKLVSDAKACVRTMRRLGIDADANTYVFLLSGYILMGSKTNEILLLWTEIKDKLSPIDGGNPIQLTEELLAGFLTIFIKYGYFKNAMDVISKLEERNMWADKEKYKDMYWRLHRRLYTSKHRSQRRVDMSQERRRQVDAFKSWVGLPL